MISPQTLGYFRTPEKLSSFRWPWLYASQYPKIAQIIAESFTVEFTATSQKLSRIKLLEEFIKDG